MNTQDTQAEVLAPETEVAISEAPQPAPAATQVATVPKTVSRITLLKHLKQLTKADKQVCLVRNVDGFTMAAQSESTGLYVRTSYPMPIEFVAGEVNTDTFSFDAGRLYQLLKLLNEDVGLRLDAANQVLVVLTELVQYKMGIEFEVPEKFNDVMPNETLIADATEYIVDMNEVKLATAFTGKETGTYRQEMEHVYLSFDGDQHCGTVASNGLTLYKRGTLTDTMVNAKATAINALPDGDCMVRLVVQNEICTHVLVEFDNVSYFFKSLNSNIWSDCNELVKFYTLLKTFEVSHAELAHAILDSRCVGDLRPLKHFGNKVTKGMIIDLTSEEVICKTQDLDFCNECEVVMGAKEFSGIATVKVHLENFTLALKTSLLNNSDVRLSIGKSNQPLKFVTDNLLIVVMPQALDEPTSPTETE